MDDLEFEESLDEMFSNKPYKINNSKNDLENKIETDFTFDEEFDIFNIKELENEQDVDVDCSEDDLLDSDLI